MQFSGRTHRCCGEEEEAILDFESGFVHEFRSNDLPQFPVVRRLQQKLGCLRTLRHHVGRRADNVVCDGFGNSHGCGLRHLLISSVDCLRQTKVQYLHSTVESNDESYRDLFVALPTLPESK